jgi:hypothetical protein
MSRIVIQPQAGHTIRLLRWYFVLALLEGLAVFVQLLRLPGKSAGQGLLGLSPLRLVIAAPILVLLVVFLWVLIALWRHPERFEKLVGRLNELAGQGRFYWVTLVVCGTAFVVCFNLILLNWINTDLYLKAYLDRLAPYALWGMLVCVQTAVFLRLLRHGTDVQVFKLEKRAVTAAIIVFAALLLLAVWVDWTRTGLVPAGGQWGGHSSPILSAQVVLALIISVSGWWLGRRVLATFSNPQSPIIAKLSGRSRDILVCLLLWGVAIWRWGAEPLRPSKFSPAPVPPNYEYYPFSDAGNYDYAAQSLLIGYGLENPLVRPLYSFFLAVAHAFSGSSYQSALEWQIPLLALIPALLYLITSMLHSRLAGFLVGLLAIIHESNSIELAGLIPVSHAKMLMSDLPATLGVIVLAAIIVLWLQDPGARRVFPLLAGGVLALTMLIRVQVVILLPVILFVLAARSRKPRKFFLNTLLLCVGLLSALTPWLWRNWLVRGRFSFSEATRTSQIGLIGQFYSLTGDEELRVRLPGETDEQYASRMLGNARQFVREHPLETVHFITAHFLNNEISTLSVLPSSFPLVYFLKSIAVGAVSGPRPELSVYWRRCCSIRGYVNNLGEWKIQGYQGVVLSSLPVLFGLLAIAAGIGAVWGRNYLAVIFLLSTNMVYSLGTALVRSSGWRFNLPVEWVGFMLYGIGLIQLCQWGITFFRNKLASLEDNQATAPVNSEPEKSWFPVKQAILGSVSFFLLVAAIPIAEFTIPERYGDIDPQAILSSLDKKGLLRPLGLNSQTLEAFLAEDRAEVLIGQGLYPRYYLAGQGQAPEARWPSFVIRDYNRLGFYLIGPKQRQVVMRIPDPPSYFPHASDVLVLGCSEGDYLEAYLIVFLKSPDVLLARSPLDQWACPGPG